MNDLYRGAINLWSCLERQDRYRAVHLTYSFRRHRISVQISTSPEHRSNNIWFSLPAPPEPSHRKNPFENRIRGNPPRSENLVLPHSFYKERCAPLKNSCSIVVPHHDSIIASCATIIATSPQPLRGLRDASPFFFFLPHGVIAVEVCKWSKIVGMRMSCACGVSSGSPLSIATLCFFFPCGAVCAWQFSQSVVDRDQWALERHLWLWWRSQWFLRENGFRAALIKWSKPWK